MEFLKINRSSKDQKKELFEIIQKYPDAIIMVDQDWMNDFKQRPDVGHYKYTLRQPCNNRAFELFENADKNSCRYYGVIEFEYIKDFYFIKSCNFLNYSLEKAKKVLFLS